MSERVNEIAARLEAATPGPWAWANTCEKGYGANVGAGCFGEDDPNCKHPLSGDLTDSGEFYVDQPIAGLDHQKAGADAEFIAHARDDVPYLLAALAAADARAVRCETRYRWLRDRLVVWPEKTLAGTTHPFIKIGPACGRMPDDVGVCSGSSRPESIDAAIDAALAAARR